MTNINIATLVPRAIGVRLVRSWCALALAAWAGAAGAVEITIACGSVGAETEICRELTREWSARSGHTVRLFTIPGSSTDQLAMYRQQFGARSRDVDVLMVDVVWPGILKEHLADLAPYAKAAAGLHFPAIVRNNSADGKLLALPWFTDAGMLYYRTDLLQKYGRPVPATWDELAATARLIQDGERRAGHAAMYGYLFQGKAYEGLTCNALEWIASSGGGGIVDPGGRLTINNPQAARALDVAARWPGSIAPRNVLSFAEEETRNVFQNGDAVFMRNWSYAWKVSQRADSKVRGKVGVAPLPHGPGGAPASALGGWQLAVSKYSAHPAVAADLVMFLTSQEVQKRRAIGLGLLPTYPALYADPEILRASPYFGWVAGVFKGAAVRPSTVTAEKYNAVSSAAWGATSAVLAGRMDGTAAVRQLELDLNRVKRGRPW